MDIYRNCLIIIPVKNEEHTIAQVISQIKIQISCKILVIDDCSSDNTAEQAKKAGAAVLKLALPLGAWGATQTGLRYAEKNGFDQAVTIDGDGQHDPKTIPQLLKGLHDQNSDVVIATDTGRGSWQRKIAWQFFKLITGLKIEDITSGFRAYSKEAISMLASPDLTLMDYQDIGVLLMIQKENLSISEVETVMSPRKIGHSRIFNTWGSVAKYMVHSFIVALCRRNTLFKIN